MAGILLFLFLNVKTVMFFLCTVECYSIIQPEYDIIQAMIDARVQQNMTQKDLSAKTGITQADIGRIENGTRNLSLSMVKKLAHGLGMQLKLEFVPMPTKNKM